jgi:hypothetical protein
MSPSHHALTLGRHLVLNDPIALLSRLIRPLGLWEGSPYSITDAAAKQERRGSPRRSWCFFWLVPVMDGDAEMDTRCGVFEGPSAGEANSTPRVPAQPDLVLSSPFTSRWYSRG